MEALRILKLGLRVTWRRRASGPRYPGWSWREETVAESLRDSFRRTRDAAQRVPEDIRWQMLRGPPGAEGAPPRIKGITLERLRVGGVPGDRLTLSACDRTGAVLAHVWAGAVNFGDIDTVWEASPPSRQATTEILDFSSRIP